MLRAWEVAEQEKAMQLAADGLLFKEAIPVGEEELLVADELAFGNEIDENSPEEDLQAGGASAAP